MIGTTRFQAAAFALLPLLARAAGAQLSTAEVYQRLDAAVNSAAASGGGDSDSLHLAPTTTPIVGSGSDSLPATLHVSTGGTANLSLLVTWNVSSSAISASAEFSAITTAGGQDSASAGFDHSFKISYQVSAPTSYALSGNLRTTNALGGNERLTCAANQTPLAGADPTTLPVGGAVPFADEGVVYPGETATIDCSVIGGSALTDSADQRWDLTVALTPLSTTPTTTTTLPRKICHQACKQAKATCRAACTGTGKERRVCRRDCRKRAKRCGASTGCALP